MCDCLLVILGIGEQYQEDRKDIKYHVLDHQMSYAGHKVDALYLDLIRSYNTDLMTNRKNSNQIDVVNEQKDYTLYKEMLLNALDLCKKEIRRSFRENGFENYTDLEFKEYMNKQIEALISIPQAYMLERYPNSMIVSLESRFQKLNRLKIANDITDIYMFARQVCIVSNLNLINLKQKYKKEINDFVQSNIK